MRYKVISKWCGWFGGWGSESNIAALLDTNGGKDWRLVRSESGIFAWWYFLPRRKVLFIFESERTMA